MNFRRLLVAVTFALVACKSSKPPFTPDGVVAVAGDQVVTVHWNAAAGALRYVVYYDGDDAPVTLSSQQSAPTADVSLAIPGLVNARKYRFAVLAANSAGVSALSAEASATPTASHALTVAVTPADGAASVSRATAIQAIFNRPVQPQTVTTAVATTACAGASFQVSADQFATCIQMSAQPVASNAGLGYTLTPAVPLAGATKYQVRVTTAAAEPGGGTLAAPFTSSFTTSAALALASSVPADGATAVSPRSAISLRFNRAPQAASLTTAAAGTACTGSVQLSRRDDNFALCVPLVLSAGSDATSFTLTPAATLAGATAYVLKVTAAALDADGVGPASPLLVGFTTDGALAVAALSPAQGSLNVALNATVSVRFNRAADPATVSTNMTGTGCTGSLQVSADGFATCVQMAAAPVASDSNHSFAVTPAGALLAGTSYAVRVTTAVTDASGAPLASVFTAAPAFTTNVALAVASTTPADGVLAVPVNTSVGVTFNRAALPSSITASTSGTGCSGSVQLSSDGFQTCLPMAAQPQALAANQTFVVTPAALLSPSTGYQVRVTTAAQDADGVALAAVFTSANGFVTDGPLAVLGTTPAGSGVPLNAADIGVVFTRAVQPASVTVNTADSQCSGSLQLSRASDNFGTCVRLATQPTSSSGNTKFLLTLAGLLDPNTSYLLRVTTAVVDVSGVPLSAAFTSAGFVTDAALAVSSVSPVDGASAVPLNTAVSITFNKPAGSITTNVDARCNGSLQLSSDGFATCVAMNNAAPVASNGGATFTARPAAPLQGGALYRLRVTTAAHDQAGVALAAQFTSAGFVVDAALAVVATAPKNGDTAVSRTGPLSVTFNKAADASTITSAIGASTTCGTFQVSTDPAFGSCLAMQAQPSADAASKTFTATPAAALPGATKIYLRISTGARDQAGVALAANSAVTAFTTRPPLAVTQVTPANTDAGIALNTTVAVTFNQPAQLSVNSADNSCSKGSLQLSSDGFQNCVKMAVTLVKSADGKTFTARAAATLAERTTYAVRVTPGALDLDGLPSAAFSSSFTTDAALAVQSTSPADNDAGVTLGPVITVTFNKPANPATVTAVTSGTACGGSVQLSADGFGTCVPMSSEPVPDQTNQVYSVTPLAPLSGQTTYQLRVTTAAADPAGVALAVPSNSSFTTQTALAVVSTSPADGATNVSTNTPIAVTFNKDIDTTSLTFSTSGTGCTGSLQLSSDNFQTCNPLVGPLTHSGFTWQLNVARSAPLAAGTTYRIRVTTDLTDSAQVPLAAPFTTPNGFTTVPRIAVTSVAPADGATGVATSAAIVVVFNKAAFNVGVNPTDTACSTYTLQLSSDGFTNCVPMSALSSSADRLTWTATPSALSPGTNYKIRVMQGVTDATGAPLAADYITPNGFTTVPTPLTVTSAPVNGAAAVAASSNLVLTFNHAPSASTLTTSGCTGSVTLASGGSCVALTGPVVSSGGTVFTYTPAAKLADGQQYVIGVSTAVHDAQGTSLAQPYRASFTVATPPANPALAAPVVTLQSAALSWPSPGGTYDHAHVYSRPSGAGSYALLASTAAGATSYTAGSLLPFRAYDFKVTSVDAAGNESAGAVASVTTAFTGTAADWLPGQAIKGIGNVRFRFTWTDTDFVAAVSDVLDNKSLDASHPDALWIAFDTDPATDATGEWNTSTVGANDVIWPFKANYVVELVLNGSSYTVNSKASGGSFAPLTTDGFNGTIDELRVPRAAIGNPAGAVRFAVLTVNKSNGFVFDLAPSNTSATDNYGFHASLTSGFAPGAASWTTAATATSVQSSPKVPAAALVTLSVSGLGANPPNVTLHGSLSPFNYDISLANYNFHDDGRYGDQTANDGIYTGVFNLGASTQELFFQFDRGGGTAEFSGGKDRVWTLSGGTETVPTVVFNTAYSATHPFALTFNVTQTAGTPTEVRGSTSELGVWGSAPGAQLSLVSGNLFSTGLVNFAAQDFTGGTRLEFKAFDTNYEGGNNNFMDDDVINRRALNWSFNGTQGF